MRAPTVRANSVRGAKGLAGPDGRHSQGGFMSSRRRFLPLCLLVLLAACGPNPVAVDCGPDRKQLDHPHAGSDDAEPSSCPTPHLIKE